MIYGLLAAIGVVVLFIAFMVLYTKFQLYDLLYKYSTAPRKWHIPGALMRAMIPIAMIVGIYVPMTIWDVLIASAVGAITFDMGVNLYALEKKKSIWHIGSTDPYDIKVGKKKWYLYGVFLLLSVLAKIFL